MPPCKTSGLSTPDLTSASESCGSTTKDPGAVKMSTNGRVQLHRGGVGWNEAEITRIHSEREALARSGHRTASRVYPERENKTGGFSSTEAAPTSLYTVADAHDLAL
jgi:hypothetical protein